MKLKLKFPRRWRRPPSKSRLWLEAYEVSLILSDIRALGGRGVTIHDLYKHAPGRYDPRYLPKVLRRMAATHYLTPGKAQGARRWRVVPYSLPKHELLKIEQEAA